MARNADGIWSTQAGSLSFAIEPRVYQRRWFFPSLGLAFAIAIGAGYRVRIRQLKQRFDLVLAERSRIARELHDTLLQGLSGITMQMQALWTRLPASTEKRALGEIIKDAGRCSTEARQSLWDLRAVKPESLRFSEKLAKLARAAAAGQPISLSLNLEPVSLGELPELEYQLLRISQEAISNALRHAHARTLEIRLQVDEKQLRLTFEDDGIGFTEGIERAESGHFGLVGMRERAIEIGAELKVSSSPGQGAEVSIHLPFPPEARSERNPELAFEHQVR